MRQHAERAEPLIRASKNLPANLDVQALSNEFWGLDEVQEFTVATVERILERRRVPRKHLVPPGMDITVPAMEAIRYSPLRTEIAALIASTMDDRKRDRAHPAFLSILSQLTRDEIRMLDVMPPPDRVLPMADLYVQVTRQHTEVIYRNIVPEMLAGTCETKSRIPAYVDNLKRLELVIEPAECALPGDHNYADLARQPFCRELVDERGEKRRTRIQKRVVALSDFGATFREVCIL